MERSKRSNPQVQDRLSELPDSVIFHILRFVPTSDVVRTTVLSKRWRNRWTTIPFLHFEFDSDIVEFRNFVNRALLRWNGIRVLSFKVVSDYDIDDSVYCDTVSWVNFAKDKGVEELHLHMLAYEYHNFVEDVEEEYRVPQCLYSCSSLKVLSLIGCNFRFNGGGNVQWNQLKSLTIKDCYGVTEHVINQILSGNPQLEVLKLTFADRGENLNIRSNSLKELSICKYFCDIGDLSLVTELTIWTPNLETLKIKGMPYSNCWLKNVSSLTRAVILFYGLYNGGDADCNFPGIDWENGFFSSQDYIAGKYSQILQPMQHVESITLFLCCHKVLEAIKARCKHSSFPNVKSLKIKGFYKSYEQLVGLLEIFPQVERLVLHEKMVEDRRYDPETVKYEANVPKSLLLQLRTIEVTWEGNEDNIFPLIEILLKYACKLEKMVFQVDGVIAPNSLLLASKKLLNMPRSSTNCTIVFLHE